MAINTNTPAFGALAKRKMPPVVNPKTLIRPDSRDAENQTMSNISDIPNSYAETEPVIGEKEIAVAAETLQKYKTAKTNLENRIVSDEQWYRLQHWEALRKEKDQASKAVTPMPTSGWLFNSICAKHADAMDNYPEASVLPRERSDEESAKTLSSVLPVVLERADFEKTYSRCWDEKLKHGTGIYGTFWDNGLENGIGDIMITDIDILNIFWEPGISDIQKSRNLFIVALEDADLLEERYPQLRNKKADSVIDVAKYVYEDDVDTSGKSLVVDWYYKKRTPSGRNVVHYCKFVGKTLLYASENELFYKDRGYYDHGDYPVHFDVLFREKGSPAGFGYVSVLRDPQLYIDSLSGIILENAALSTKVRFLKKKSSEINEEQLLDNTQAIIDVEGDVDDRHIRQVQIQPVSGNVLSVLDMKVNELKETGANRDFNSGSTASGVTAASAISALQEAGNKVSRDIISASYRVFRNICYMSIELMRQFYDEKRSFRITGAAAQGGYSFVDFSNADIREQTTGLSNNGEPLIRKPIFDIVIKAQRKNPFTRASQNELAVSLYKLGFFNPERAQEALGAIELMEFEGKDGVAEQINKGQTMFNMCQRLMAQVDKMAAIIQSLTGEDMGIAGASSIRSPASKPSAVSGKVNSAVTSAQKPVSDYSKKMINRSTPNVSMQGGVR